MRDMIQQVIGLIVGAIVTLVLLPFMSGATLEEAVVPVVIGAVAAFLWPIVIGWFLVRRAKQRRENQIQGEVQRQMDQQKRG